ncbi:MAG: PilZ domain-containing protein [bacterium]
MAEREQDRRNFERVSFEKEIHARLPETGEEFETKVLDISLKGLLVAQPRDVEIDSENTVNIEILLSDELTVSLTGEVVHVAEGEMGIKWTEIDDESMSHLRRILELNLGDAEEIRRELSELTS